MVRYSSVKTVLLSECFSKCIGSWEKLKRHILEYSLSDRVEEIHFAKKIRPAFCSLWFYVLERNRIEHNEPKGTASVVKEFHEEEFQLIQRYYSQHAFYHHYYKSGTIEIDELYFIASCSACEGLFSDLSIREQGSQPAFDLLFARFMAFEKFKEYLLGRLKPIPKHQNVVENQKRKIIKPTLINLSVDQLGLITRAADDVRLLEGRSFNRICEELAQYISTSAKRRCPKVAYVVMLIWQRMQTKPT